MDNINEIIHQPIRLKILTVLHMDKRVTFSELKKELNVSDWNLWSHLDKLEKAWYVRVEKSFVNKKPQSIIFIENKWEMELIAYIVAIENIFKWIKS